MRFCLDHKEIGGYRFQEYTFYNTKHTGTDWVANFVSLYAPVSGNIIATPVDYGGGQWINFQCDDGSLHLFAHLSSVHPLGRYEEGQQIGITGNTGGYTTGPHLHEQIYVNGNLIDPEGYYKGETMDTELLALVNKYNQERYNENAAQDIRINDLYTKLNETNIRMDNVEKTLQEVKSQLDRIETTLAKVLSDEVIQEAKIGKVEPQKGFLELLTDWIKGLKK